MQPSITRQLRNFLAVFIVFFSTLNAADLHKETLSAWNDYVHSVSIKANRRASGTGFLQLDDRPELLQRVRDGEIIVEPAIPSTPKAVPSGLIHDWLGAVFVPRVTVDQMLSVVRDYARYKDFYQPAVLDSRPIALSDEDDQFSLLLANRSFFRKRALESDYKLSQFRVSDRRWYSVAETTRVQEIDDYGTSGQHAMPENVGSGMIWRLFTVMRFEERDGGVYAEVEAIALSRDIPISMRWIVDPIVKRVARNSLVVSLGQTREAVAANQKTEGISVAATR